MNYSPSTLISKLDRVLAAHPGQLERETGWKMSVTKKRNTYDLVVMGDDLRNIGSHKSVRPSLHWYFGKRRVP